MKLIAARFLMPTQYILLNIIRISTTLQLTTKVQPTSTRESETQLKCALLKENVVESTYSALSVAQINRVFIWNLIQLLKVHLDGVPAVSAAVSAAVYIEILFSS